MAKKKYNVILAERADEMLIRHIEFLAQVNPAAARKLLSEFKKAGSKLTSNPYQFPYADALDIPGIASEFFRKCLFNKRYKIIFVIDDYNVFIDAIIDCRRENSDIFS